MNWAPTLAARMLFVTLPLWRASTGRFILHDEPADDTGRGEWFLYVRPGYGRSG